MANTFIPHFGKARYLKLLDRYIRPQVANVFVCSGPTSVGKSRILSVAQDRWQYRGELRMKVLLSSVSRGGDMTLRTGSTDVA